MKSASVKKDAKERTQMFDGKEDKKKRKHINFSKNNGNEVRYNVLKVTREMNRFNEIDVRLVSREKQINIGKETMGYKIYSREVKRRHRTADHPWTPDKYKACSTRSWQGLMRIWRRKLHFWDPPQVADEYKKRSSFNVLASLTGETLGHSGDSKCSSQTSDEFTGSNDYVLSEKDLFDDERNRQVH